MDSISQKPRKNLEGIYYWKKALKASLESKQDECHLHKRFVFNLPLRSMLICKGNIFSIFHIDKLQ
jgi:hypothetical protein